MDDFDFSAPARPNVICPICSYILCPQRDVSKVKQQREDQLQTALERLRCLMSEDGVNIKASRREFREAVKSGCIICVDLEQVAQRRKELVRYRVGTEAEDDDQDDDNKTLTLNYFTTAEFNLNIAEDTHHSSEWTKKLRNINGLKVTPVDVYSGRDIPLLALDIVVASCSCLPSLISYQSCEHLNPRGVIGESNHNLAADPAAQYITSRPIDPEMGTDHSVAVVESWMNQCTRLHSTCNASRGASQLPTRVIDVGEHTEGEKGGYPEPRIYETKREKGNYVCLSYCWGGPQTSILTEATLEQKKRGFALDSLPSTLRDAIWWTRSLGLRYLWVDALCILQDSSDDKAREINDMCRIYQSAYLTLAAAKAKTVRSGFRQPCLPPNPWDPSRWTQTQIKILLPNGDTGIILAEDSSLYYSASEWLNKRCWALQESLLSTHLLTFGQRYMYMQCKEAIFVNGGATSMAEEPLRLDLNILNASGGEPLTDCAAGYLAWQQILEGYTSRETSFIEDRLPALSGIATVFNQAFGGKDTYLAGLWLGGLPSSLGWVTERPRGIAPKAGSEDEEEEEEDIEEVDLMPEGWVPYSSPGTWSWVSVPSQVVFKKPENEDGTPGETDSIQTKVTNYLINLRNTEALLGEVTQAEITLYGRIRYYLWDGDEAIWDREENRVPFSAEIGERLQVSEHHIAQARPDYLDVYLNDRWIEASDDPRRDGLGEYFHMGRGRGCENEGRTELVAMVPISNHEALILKPIERNKTGKSIKWSPARSKLDIQTNGTDVLLFVRVGHMEFAFLSSIDFRRNMADFFAGCEPGTVTIV